MKHRDMAKHKGYRTKIGRIYILQHCRDGHLNAICMKYSQRCLWGELGRIIQSLFTVLRYTHIQKPKINQICQREYEGRA
jgi:hypothetical protein